MISELCPHCENEVEIKESFTNQKCPECGKRILPCSMCKMDETNCNECLAPPVEE